MNLIYPLYKNILAASIKQSDVSKQIGGLVFSYIMKSLKAIAAGPGLQLMIL